MLMNSIVISVFKYGAPLLINSNNNIMQKLNTLIIKCARPILGFESYKWNTHKIMKSLKWNTFYHTVIIESIVFIQKCIFEDTPQTITELITYSINRSQNVRSIRKPYVKYPIDSSKHLKEYIYEYFSSNHIPKNETT